MSRIGYARVSTIEQNLDRQQDAFEALNLDRIFSDKASGRDTARPGLQEMLGYMRAGDTIYVESISRLARSTKDLLSRLLSSWKPRAWRSSASKKASTQAVLRGDLC